MQRRWCAVVGAVLVTLALGPVASAAGYGPGSRSLGDPLLPALGNGGYDVQHYALDIDYDPVANSMRSTTGITARATQDLSELSLDFRGLEVTAAIVDGAPATFARDGDKLVLTPRQGIDGGKTFQIRVDYNGVPQQITDPDGSLEGWLRTADGAFVVNEPMGAMGWFPCNNHPLDKATYDFRITVPADKTALGNGELVSRTENPNGTTTWHWREGYPMATYLSTATVGDFDYTQGVGATALGAGGRPLELYNAIDSSHAPADKTAITSTLGREDAIAAYFDGIYGRYPFDSVGAVVDRLSGVGYVLEVQTKIHFPTRNVSVNTLSHEIAHQWFGNSVSLKRWGDIWLNEGWATWSQWYWSNKQNGSPTTPEQLFLNNYNSTSNPGRWSIPTAALPDASHLFDTFPVYTRGAMTLEALRQIIGEAPFLELARTWQAEHRYGNADTADFIALAKRIARDHSGFEATNLAKLDAFFQQWLYAPGKPALTPTTFFQRTDAPAEVNATVPATLALSVGGPASFGAFTPGVARDYSATTTANVTSTAGEATLSVADPSPTAPGRLVNGAFALAQPLQARASAAFAPVGGAPTTLHTYAGPVPNDPVGIELRQPIGATEPLRTGRYGKTLVLTLSTATP